MDRLFIETKLLADESGAISGIAWKYDQPDRVGDMVAPGAFAKAAFPIPMIAFHDMTDPVGVWESAEDKGNTWQVKGRLFVEDVARAREIRAMVQGGAIKALSIGFVAGQTQTRPSGGRLIKTLELFEVSLVTVGMHPAARITSAKSAMEALTLATALNRAASALTR